MTRLLSEVLAGLGGELADLNGRVRVAVAGELARATGDAVGAAVRAALAGSAGRPVPGPGASRRPSPGRWDEEDDWGPSDDRWVGDPDEPAHRRPGPGAPGDPADDPAVTAATAGLHLARWCLAGRAPGLAAAGAGLGAGLVGLFGGPAGRAMVAVLAAAGDLLDGVDALGTGAARLGR